MADENPISLEVDNDWKAQAQREKESLEAASKAKAGAAAAAPPAAKTDAAAPTAAPGGAAAAPAAAAPRKALPQASFEVLVQQIVTQIMLYLGEIPHPSTGRRMRDVELAKHHVDTLGMLEQKTKNNLTEDEQKLLDSALYEMRMHYVSAIRGR